MVSMIMMGENTLFCSCWSKKNGCLARTRRTMSPEGKCCYGYEREKCIVLRHCTQGFCRVKEKTEKKYRRKDERYSVTEAG